MDDAEKKTTMKNTNFNAQHSPMGAFMSFTCGNIGAGGGIGLEIGRPPDQNLFVGVKQGDRHSSHPIICLPFVQGASPATTNAAADFQVGQVTEGATYSAVQTYPADAVTRDYRWATDTWTTPDLSFTIYTPFGSIPEPSTANADLVRAALLPAVTATLRIDNLGGTTTKTAIFAIHFKRQGTRVFETGDDGGAARGAVGFGWRRSMGVLAKVETDAPTKPGAPQATCEPIVFQRWSIAEAVAAVNDPIHRLGTCGGIAVEVPAGVACTITLAIGVHLDGIVTTGLEGRYLYSRYYASLDDVLTTALERAEDLQFRAARLDAQLASSRLSADQQFLVAHSTRSYYGSTQLLDVGGEPFWVVNEGEYCMMNTLDLSIDQAFWELDRNPWVVRNLLDNFGRRYSYVDELQGPNDRRLAGGMSFTHDMGVNNNFSPVGHSSYELPKLTGCFSYMTAEQLCNWVLLATCYVARTGDDGWLRRGAPTVLACLQSLVNRGEGNGFTQYDSSRCEGGQEITTYDSLDHSLAQTRNNVYMAVKCWASYVGLSLLARMLNDSAAESTAVEHATRAARAINGCAGADGVFPAIFEPENPGHQARILPAAEGLMYLLYWERTGFPDVLREVRSRTDGNELIDSLRRHTLTLLKDPSNRNRFPDGGVRLSSTSDNSWMSKIAILQHVARELFDVNGDGELHAHFAQADAAHVRWQQMGSAYWACSDQFVNGEAKGSRYYPRIITTALWLDEPGRPSSSVVSPALKVQTDRLSTSR